MPSELFAKKLEELHDKQKAIQMRVSSMWIAQPMIEGMTGIMNIIPVSMNKIVLYVANIERAVQHFERNTDVERINKDGNMMIVTILEEDENCTWVEKQFYQVRMSLKLKYGTMYFIVRQEIPDVVHPDDMDGLPFKTTKMGEKEIVFHWRKFRCTI